MRPAFSIRPRLSPLLLLTAALGLTGCGESREPGRPSTQEPASGWNRVTEFLSADLRTVDEEITALRREIRSLPAIFPEQQTDRIGYTSRPSNRQDRRNRKDARFILLDLGERQDIDAIVLVPAEYAIDASPAPGYGFPVRWRIEVSDEPTFAAPVIVADHTGADFANPGRFPVVVRAADLSGRYVRLTATRLWGFDGRSLLALGEIMVLQGPRNLAAGLPPDAIRVTDSDEVLPRWSKHWLVDGQSLLGAPMGTVPARTEGYQSAPAADPDTVKWVQLDFGRPVLLQEIRLYPARAGEYPYRRGFGFPERWRVELSDDPEFTTGVHLLAQHEDANWPSPYENPVSIPVPALTARCVRLTASRLTERAGDYVLALAEMQALGADENLATGAAVQALDSRESGIWSRRYLTDGSNSQRNLLPWPEWLAAMERRRAIAERLRDLGSLRTSISGTILRRSLAWGSALIAGLVLASVVFWWRGRRERLRELAALRRRIARDVHDEIGSGLGTISLLSQMARGNASHPDSAREDFTEIHNISREITESLRDIVWLIRPDTRTLGDLAQRLKETAGSMLAGVPHEFETDPAARRHELPLEFKRQILMFFKEALHNLIRHAQATRATLRVGGDGSAFLLTIEDNGCGFDPACAASASGTGLPGMRQRAESLGGSLEIQSAPGEGTVLRLRVPYR